MGVEGKCFFFVIGTHLEEDGYPDDVEDAEEGDGFGGDEQLEDAEEDGEEEGFGVEAYEGEVEGDGFAEVQADFLWNVREIKTHFKASTRGEQLKGFPKGVSRNF